MPNILDDDFVKKNTPKRNRGETLFIYTIKLIALVALFAFMRMSNIIPISYKTITFLLSIWLINGITLSIQTALNIGRSMAGGCLLLILDALLIGIFAWALPRTSLVAYGIILLASLVNVGIIELIRRGKLSKKE